jgi:hypothetical protein
MIRRVTLAFGVVLASWAAAQAPAAPETPDASKVPDPEKIKISADSVTRMRGALKDVLQKLEEARNTKDVVKLNCVNEKLTQVKGLLRISEQSDVALQESIARRETATAEHEFTKVTIARSKVEQLRAEAEQCIGQLAFRRSRWHRCPSIQGHRRRRRRREKGRGAANRDETWPPHAVW